MKLVDITLNESDPRECELVCAVFELDDARAEALADFIQQHPEESVDGWLDHLAAAWVKLYRKLADQVIPFRSAAQFIYDVKTLYRESLDSSGKGDVP